MLGPLVTSCCCSRLCATYWPMPCSAPAHTRSGIAVCTPAGSLACPDHARSRLLWCAGVVQHRLPVSVFSTRHSFRVKTHNLLQQSYGRTSLPCDFHARNMTHMTFCRPSSPTQPSLRGSLRTRLVTHPIPRANIVAYLVASANRTHSTSFSPLLGSSQSPSRVRFYSPEHASIVSSSSILTWPLPSASLAHPIQHLFALPHPHLRSLDGSASGPWPKASRAWPACPAAASDRKDHPAMGEEYVN